MIIALKTLGYLILIIAGFALAAAVGWAIMMGVGYAATAFCWLIGWRDSLMWDDLIVMSTGFGVIVGGVLLGVLTVGAYFLATGEDL